MGLGLILGLAFVYAGLNKFLDPTEFAEVIISYQLLPPKLIGMVAAGLPLLEAGAGTLLALGCLFLPVNWRRSQTGTPEPSWSATWRRVALAVILLQLALFILILLLTMARGLEISCGCGLVGDRPVGWAAVGEDLVLLGLASWLYQREWRHLILRNGG